MILFKNDNYCPLTWLFLMLQRYSDGQVRHYHIKKNEKGSYYIAEKYAFPSISELVHYHKHNSAGMMLTFSLKHNVIFKISFLLSIQ